MADWAAKRFWKETLVVETEGGFSITLDGRSVKTPAKAALVVPTRALAERIAEEWDAQEEQIDPSVMPATRGANAAIDKVAIQFDEVAQMLCDYGDSDLLCYRAEHPVELVARQADAWDPILDWAAEEFDARLEIRSGIMHQPQSAQALQKLSAPVFEMSNFELAAFHDLVAMSGSLVLAHACARGFLKAQKIWDIAQLDENYQAELWGEDEEAQAAAAVKCQSFLHAAWFFEASKN